MTDEGVGGEEEQLPVVGPQKDGPVDQESVFAPRLDEQPAQAIGPGAAILENVIRRCERRFVRRMGRPHFPLGFERFAEDVRSNVVGPFFRDDPITKTGHVDLGPHVHPRAHVKFVIARFEVAERAALRGRRILDLAHVVVHDGQVAGRLHARRHGHLDLEGVGWEGDLDAMRESRFPDW